MAEQEIKVPDLGGIDEVEVIEVCVAPGDGIEQEGTLIVLESDKATMEVPCPVAGKVISLAVAVGDKVGEGAVVGVVDVEGTEGNESAAASGESPDTTAEQQPQPSDTSTESPKDAVQSEPGGDVEVTVPDLGGIDEVEVIELSAGIGDELQLEDPIITLESDKATMEVPSPVAGKVKSFSVAVGDKVKMGDVVAVVESTGTAGSTNKVSTPSAESSTPSKPISAPSTPPKASQSSAVPVNAPSGQNVHAGPAVRKLARELGVDLSQVAASGPKCRVLKDDLHEFVKQRVNAPQAAVGQVRGSDEDFSRFGAIESVPLNKIKQATAKNMANSWATIPQVTQFDEADITDLENYRKTKAASMAPEGVKVTPLAFILKAVVKALQAFPNFNASLGPDGTSLIQKQYYNVGIAVDTPEGLLVPNIKNTETKGVIELAQDSAALAQKARDKKLAMDAMAGTSFTISSLGGIGGTSFTPIVNAPQVAILGVSKAQMKPVWNGSEFEPRLILPISVSYDHRVIDGAEGARFTRYLCELLSDLRHLIL